MKQSDIINPHTAALQSRHNVVAYFHGDYKYIKESLEKLIAAAEGQQQKIEKLQAFIAYYTNCPCCGQNDKCLEGCTFRDDLPNDYDIMQDAREAMR